jgi:tripartite-type tricarboxylate transporter receptor subunit TctC
MIQLRKKLLPATFAWVQALALCSAPALSWSQEKYPSRPIEMVVAFPAGGFADVTGRIFSE